MNYNKGNKKAQITLFIIMGIIILLAAGTFIYIRQQAGIPKGEAIPAIEEVPIEFQPAKAFVEYCVIKTSEEALQKIGEQGGFFNLTESGIAANQNNPTESDAVSFPGAWIIPYWWHLSSPNDCSGNCEFAIVPENQLHLYAKDGSPSIENELAKYLNKNLRNCLGDFSSLKAQGFGIEELGDIDAVFTVTQDDVAVLVNYPTEVSKRESKQRIDKYFIRVPVNLRRVYELATTITTFQAQYSYLEKNVINLIAAQSELDEKKLPPMHATDFDFVGGISWQKPDIERLVENDVLMRYITGMQVYGTYNYAPILFPDSSLSTALYDMLTMPLTTYYYDLATRFSYLTWWPSYFELNCNGNLCQPQSASSNLISLIGIQRYDFLYDVSFPTLVEITEPDALNKKGYTFRFFLEGNIRDNSPLNANYTRLVGLDAGLGMFCDEDKRNSGNITINIKDGKTDEPVEGASIAYTFAGTSCLIGETDAAGISEEKFPVALSGIISYIKEDYLGYSQLYTTRLDEGGSLNVVLEPYRYINATVRKKNADKTSSGWAFTNRESSLYPTEQALISLKRIGNLEDEEYSALEEFWGNSTTEKELKLVPGKYEVEITLRDYDTIAVHDSFCTDTDWTGDCESYEDVDIEFNSTNNYLSTTTLNWTLRKEDIDNPANSRIIFYAVSPDLKKVAEGDRNLEDIEQIGKIDDYVNAYLGYISPRFG